MYFASRLCNIISMKLTLLSFHLGINIFTNFLTYLLTYLFIRNFLGNYFIGNTWNSSRDDFMNPTCNFNSGFLGTPTKKNLPQEFQRENFKEFYQAFLYNFFPELTGIEPGNVLRFFFPNIPLEILVKVSPVSRNSTRKCSYYSTRKPSNGLTRKSRHLGFLQ